MLLGAGGVVALVVGAWSVMWAVQRVPGRTFGTWYPAVAAFVASIYAFAMLTAQSEIGIGLIQWHRGDPAERAEVVATTLVSTWRPLLAAGVAVVALVVTVLLARRPGSPLDEHRPHVLERAAVAAMVALAGIDLWVWIALQRGFDTVTSGREMLLVAVPRAQLLTLIGAAAACGLLALSVFVGLWRYSRRRHSPAGA